MFDLTPVIIHLLYNFMLIMSPTTPVMSMFGLSVLYHDCSFLLIVYYENVAKNGILIEMETLFHSKTKQFFPST